MLRKMTAAAAALAVCATMATGMADAATSKLRSTTSDSQGSVRLMARRGCDSFLQCMFGGHRDRGDRNSGFWSGGKARQMVAWNERKYAPGSIIIRTPERKLYYVLPGGQAMQYSVGVGRDGFQWGGVSRIVRKAEWPDWHPPKIMIQREAKKGHIIPDFMEGGPGNPLGARALYIGGTMFRIHGTNNAASIGGAVSSGCIRMMNADVIDLYERANVGARVYVYQ
jgi:lipoprotein-anchoring transpeptidase ErfK/SrfK